MRLCRLIVIFVFVLFYCEKRNENLIADYRRISASENLLDMSLIIYTHLFDAAQRYLSFFIITSAFLSCTNAICAAENKTDLIEFALEFNCALA